MIRKLSTVILLLICLTLKGQDYQKRLTELEEKANTYFYSNKDSTYFYFDKIYELTINHKDYITAIDKLNEVCFAAGSYYDIPKIKTTIEKLDVLIAQNSKALDTLEDKGFYQKNYFLYNQGNYYHKLDDFFQSEIYFNTIIKNITAKPNFDKIPDDVAFLSTCYSFIAQINSLENQFEIASEYYQKNIRLYKNYFPEDINGLHKVYNLYASSLYAEKKYTKAKKYWLETLAYSQNNFNTSNRNSIVTTSLLLSNLYKDAGQIDSATYYLNTIDKYKIENDPFSNRYLYAKGDIYLKEKKYTAALKAYKDAISVSLKSELPWLQKKIGDLYFEKGELDHALINYQLGLQELSTNFNSTNIAQNPEPTTVTQKQLLLRILGAKAKTLNALKKNHYNSFALQAVDTSLKTLDILKPNYRNQSDKLNLVEDSFPLFESGIEACYQLYNKEKDEKYLDHILRYAEKSKAVLLLDALLSTRATKFANIPEKLLQTESHLKSTISFTKKQIETGSNISSELEDELFKLQKEYTELIKTLELEYPSYYNLRYNNETIPISTVQNNLANDEIIISYFYGSEFIYALAITSDSKQILRIPITPTLEKKIVTIHDMLSSSTSNLKDLNHNSYQLYDTLLAPLLTDTQKKKLLIIPDGLLNYIPFDALNSQENGTTYLIERYAVSSINSLTLLDQLKKNKASKNSILAFAPLFNGEPIQGYELRTGLAPLPNNTREVTSILTSFEGNPYIGTQASLSNFNANVSAYNIIHLATHAIFDDSSPEYSYLAFTPEDKNDYVLYVSDIYNLKLDADLVTLSACETGLGALKKGEGALSLSRAFFYCGARSLVNTLWNVVDLSASEIMNDFYMNLADGDRKDVALQKAKLSFITKNKENALAHPYYWSSFIIQGNTNSLNSTPNYWMWMLVGVVFIVPIYLGRKRLFQFFK